MDDILKETILPKLEMLKNQQVILYAAAGIIAIIVFVVILKILKKTKNKAIKLINFQEPFNEQPEKSYEPIIKRIKQLGKKHKSVLFASVGEALPITIPVNVSIELAKGKKRCLLIDLDLKRDAVAEAFKLDVEKNSLNPKAIQTEFENLWVWPGHHFVQLKQMNIMEIAQKAADRFDFILINAPSLLNSPDRRQIILAAQAAFICTKDTAEAAKLTELIKPLDCTIIGRIQIPQPDLQE